jgi:hypothetical protein
MTTDRQHERAAILRGYQIGLSRALALTDKAAQQLDAARAEMVNQLHQLRDVNGDDRTTPLNATPNEGTTP